MKKLAVLLAAPLLFGCAPGTSSSPESGELPTAYVQERAQLDIDEALPAASRKVVGRWYPYVDLPKYGIDKGEAEFRARIGESFSQAAAEGVGEVYFHARPNGDAYYRSELFPRSPELPEGFDPVKVALEEARSRGLEFHIWINPLRLQTEERMKSVPETFAVKKWAEAFSPNAKLVDGRWYLVPASEEARELVAESVRELLENYDADGVHIDDYFYPTTDESFDAELFAASGRSDLAEWRRENTTLMVKAIYDAVKSQGSGLRFGISPQGNIAADYDKLYADVRLWAGEPGYCDYILPQIYYGFLNESLPFEATLREWEALRGEGIGLVIGLAGYKAGELDKWAGASGEREWIDDPDVIAKQIALVEASSADGYAVYGG